MIGRVLFRVGGSDAVATLDDDGTWSVSIDGDGSEELASVIAGDLNTSFSLAGSSPADGQLGYAQVHAAAKAYNGKAEGLADLPDSPPGVVF